MSRASICAATRPISVIGWHDGRQRRMAGRGGGDVVVTHHADVTGHRSAQPVDHLDHPEGRQVVGRDHPVEIWKPTEKSFCCFDSAGGGEIAVFHRGGVRGAGRGASADFGHRIPPTLQPVPAGHHVRRSGDHADAPPPGVDQVAGCQVAAEPVVDVDVAEPVQVLQRASDEHRGQPGVQGVPLPDVGPVVGHHDRAVDQAGPQVSHDPVRSVAATRGQQDQLEVRVVQADGDALDHRPEEGVAADPPVRFRDHQCDRIGPLGDQGPGRTVGHETQFGDRCPDRGHGPGTDPTAAVDGSGRGRPGHAGGLRDVVQGRSAAAGRHDIEPHVGGTVDNKALRVPPKRYAQFVGRRLRLRANVRRPWPAIAIDRVDGFTPAPARKAAAVG